MNKSYTDSDIVAVATAAHDAWREDRKLADGTYKPRLETATNGQTVDIANTDYSDLPVQWQLENRKGAESALLAIQVTSGFGHPDDIEAAAAFVHGAWAARNAKTAPAHLLVNYSELPDDEREKDRHFVRLALEVREGAL